MRNAFFLNITKEEKESIQDKHRSQYDGYQVMQPKGNMTPLTVGDYALDKEGVTVSNLGEVKKYTNTEVNRKLKKVCEQCSGLYEGEMCEQCSSMSEGETCEQCNGEMKEGEQCEQCASKKYTMEEIEEGIKVKSKASLVQEQINESLKWFKKII